MADWTGQPAYVQVASQLRRAIREGRYEPGSQLPSYEALMKTYDVSITVIRSAVRELKTEGLVTTHQGKGAFVRSPIPPPGQTMPGEGSQAFREVMAEIRSLHDDLDQVGERLSRVERLVLGDENTGRKPEI